MDHLAVVMRMFLTGENGPSGPPTNLGAKIDVKALVGAQEDEVAEIFRDLHPIDWQSNIHDHGAVFVKQLRQHLEHRLTRRASEVQRSHLSQRRHGISGVFDVLYGEESTIEGSLPSGLILGQHGRRGKVVYLCNELWRLEVLGIYYGFWLTSRIVCC